MSVVTLLGSGISVARGYQHCRIDPGVGHFSGHGMADLVSTWDGPNDPAHGMEYAAGVLGTLLSGGWGGTCFIFCRM
jgi:hypothetical protein